MMIDRRMLIAGASSAFLSLPVGAQPVPPERKSPERKYDILLNAGYIGPVSFMILADDKGYLRDAGLAVSFTKGNGAAAIVPKVRAGQHDAGYGDMTALIERIAREAPHEGPVAIYTTFNSVPFTIAVATDSTIRTPKDLEGKTIWGDTLDAALLTFDMFCKANAVDISKVNIVRSDEDMGGKVAEMVRTGKIDGVFGFVNTIIATSAPHGIDGARELRFLTYADNLPDMYGNTLFVTREVYRDDKALLPGLVRAFNRGLSDTIGNPDAGIDALARRDSGIDKAVQRKRLTGTLAAEMAHPEGAEIGIGDMDDARLARLITLVAEAKKLPRIPEVGEVFDRSFLPPDPERIRLLARN